MARNYLLTESGNLRFDSIKEIISDMETSIKNTPTLERDVQQLLTSSVSQLFHAALNNSDGYCIKFQLPIVAVNNLFRKFNLNVDEVEYAFRKDWGYPPKAHMYSDSYYQILLLVLSIGLRRNNRALVTNSLLIILIKLWNGRRSEFLPYCNPNVMQYVLNNMLSNKFHAAKFDTPLALLTNHYVPTILQKYSDRVRTGDPKELKVIFSQSYGRIFQLFYQRPAVNPATGKKESTSGLAALYYKAHREGASTHAASVSADKETGETTFDQYGTSHEIDEVVSSVSDFIALNRQATYPEGFISQINRLTHVSAKVLHMLSVDIHNPKYHDYLVDIITLIFSRTEVKQKSDICSANFILSIKKKVISSKNNADTKKLTSILDLLIDTMLKKHSIEYSKYSGVQRIQIRTSLVHIIVYNIKKVVCHQQATQQINLLNQLKPTDVI